MKLHTYNGVRYSTSELAQLSGISGNTILARLRSGWPVELAVTVPTPRQRRAVASRAGAPGVSSNLEQVLEAGAWRRAQDAVQMNFSKDNENADRIG